MTSAYRIQNNIVTLSPDNEAKEEESKQDSDDIKELKNVLAGLKLGGIGGHKPHQLHDQEDAPKGKKHYIPSDTPLNTQMDGVIFLIFLC